MNACSTSRFRLVAVVVAGVCAFLNLYAPQPLLPTLAQAFHVGAGRIGLVVSATTLGVALSAPFMGMLADRFGRRTILVISLFGLAIPTAMVSTTGSLEAMVVWRFLVGIFMPGIIASAIAYIAEEWREDAPKAVATYVTSTVFGGFVGRVATGFIAEHGGWRLSFLVLGATTLLGAILVQRWLPASRGFVPEKHWWRGLLDIGHHLGNPVLLATYAVGFSVLFSLVATFTYVTFHLAAPPYKLGPAQQGMIFFVYLVGLFVTPASGGWIQRFGAAQAVLGAIAFSCLGVLLTLARPLPLVIAGLALCSSGVFVCQAAASNFVGQAADRSRSVAVGLYLSFYYAGGSAGAFVPGWVWDRAGWPGCVALVVVVQLLCAGIVTVFWRAPALDVDVDEAVS